MTRRLLLPLLVFLGVVFVWQGHSYAQSTAPTPSHGITVAPAFASVQIGSQQPEATFSIGVRNDFDTPVTLNASLAGLTIKQNSLVPGSDPEGVLSDITTVSPSVIELKPKESVNISVTVKDSKELSPGGHYASLLIRQVNTDSRQVTIEPAISTTVYIIKEDGAIRKVSIDDLTIKRSLFSLPKYADITFKNQGNVPVVPRGVVSLARESNSDYFAQSIINEQSVPLFQNESVRLRTDIKTYQNSWIPGRYSMSVQYRFENQVDSQTATVTFWYVPKGYPIAILSSIFAVIIMWPQHRRRFLKAQFSKLIVRVKMFKKSKPATQISKPSTSTKKIAIKDHSQPKKSSKKKVSVRDSEPTSTDHKVTVKRTKK